MSSHPLRSAVGPNGATAHESRILARLAFGMRSPEIARELGLGRRSVHDALRAYQTRHHLDSTSAAILRFARSMVPEKVTYPASTDEARALDLLVSGYTVQQAARTLNFSQRTIYKRAWTYSKRHRLGSMKGVLVAWARTRALGARVAS